MNDNRYGCFRTLSASLRLRCGARRAVDNGALPLLQGDTLLLSMVVYVEAPELLGRGWALLDPVDRIEGLRSCARSSQEKPAATTPTNTTLAFHFTLVERSAKTRISRLI